MPPPPPLPKFQGNPLPPPPPPPQAASRRERLAAEPARSICRGMRIGARVGVVMVFVSCPALQRTPFGPAGPNEAGRALDMEILGRPGAARPIPAMPFA
ncbi:hypothetical protein RT97_23345 [Variovorax paradoxus]|uniref:Uncharacterized protein n=1 Tax=Variovorax paradoxus TaxID=34073 RepID=A0A0D0KHS4_VARPD|nr:hypothetical protein RT97_23345 [Variovorax paradoxus]